MESLVAMMAFCEAPFDGTSAPSSGAARGDSASSATGGNLVALPDATENKCPVERLVATMAFCEAPFDGTFDGTSAPSSSGAAGGNSSASAGNAPEAGGGQDAVTKEELMRDKAGTVVDGLTIFETIALQ